MSQKNKNQCYSAKVAKDCPTGCVIRPMLWPLMNVFDTCFLFSGLHESQPPSAGCLSALSGFSGQRLSLGRSESPRKSLSVPPTLLHTAYVSATNFPA